MQRRARQSALFLCVWLFIALVSIHDGYLMAIYRNAHGSAGIEQNPAAQLLIRFGGGQVWLLLAAKACGTVVACTLLLVLFWRRPRIAWAVALLVAGFQLLLLLYLQMA